MAAQCRHSTSDISSPQKTSRKLYSQDKELENIQLKFEQIASSIFKLTQYIPKLDEIDATIEKFSIFHETCTRAIALNLSCHELNMSIEDANNNNNNNNEVTTKTELGFKSRHPKTKSKTTNTTFERTFQVILDSLPKQYRTKKEHIEKLEKIVRCLYLHKDKYLTTQEISSRNDMSSVHSTVYLNILHNAGKVCGVDVCYSEYRH
ncbi:hypothetical protein Gasu_13230 isoform 1 [Galdieria sulphuraria]|uniref:Uncharacterized protein n=1 Tax=Galdieria sulphuraria TaxID=130081 RepID=M2Y5W6_GALSU|nr:hypothetical protein Gasu_13230 isoform 1 [Galdieria sulphuraria]EME31358.1 hypothetical protein isoform 1 [Galdieria sulphuraria]|eukprot:XP_005707878.1 hypothetical protein isoform 1 [Galdieria sulphuraria]